MNLSIRDVSQGWVLGLLMIALHQGAMAQSVPTLTLRQGGGVSGFALEGVVQAVNQTTLAAQTNGRITALKVKAGDRVKSGQVIATIEDRESSVAAERSQAQWTQADAELRNAQAQFDRTRDLQHKGFLSKAALDTAMTQLQSAKAAAEQAKASIKLSGITQSYGRITAPYDGWILQTHIQSGELAVHGAPVATIYAPQPLRAVVQMPTSKSTLAKSAVQQSLELVDSESPAALRTTGQQIVPASDPVSQTTEWRWDIHPQDAGRLIPGQAIRVRFAGGVQAAGVTLMVPRQAVVRRGELTAVYVQEGAGFQLRAIRLGAAQSGGAQEVVAGLRDGDTIALDPVKAAAQR